MTVRWRAVAGVAALLGALATFPYLPFLGLPYISDDYLQVALGRRWGPVASWPDLAADALYRCRATSIVLTYWTTEAFGFSSSLLQAQSILIHVLNTLLIAALGSWSVIGWRAAVVAAGFFAVHEGHQEAVVWYAALPELLVFLFALASLHAWLRWALAPSGRRGWYLLSLGLFVLALLSKESGVAVVPLMAGVAWWTGARSRRDWLAALAPYGLISLAYAAAIFSARQTHLHLNDGTFSLDAPVASVLARSGFRLLWVWGLAALMWLAYRRRAVDWRLPAAALLWIGITLLPYSFLSYMPRVPSRHVYWASAGLAFLFAAGLLSIWRQWRSKPVLAGLAAIVIAHNCAWLWWKKLPQYERRAAPTENLVRFAERAPPGPITVKCFPYSPELAQLAVEMRTGRPAATVRWDPQAPHGESVFCDPVHP